MVKVDTIIRNDKHKYGNEDSRDAAHWGESVQRKRTQTIES
jgi:hypothetical protein